MWRVGKRLERKLLPSPRWMPNNNDNSSLRCRGFSSRGPAPAPKRPGYSIPAQGFVFSALLLPVLGFTMYAGRYGPSDEELEQRVRERYAERVAETKQKNQAMADFFQQTIHNPDGKMDDSLREVLYAGKGGKKRLYAVDEKLYGTEEGVAEKKRQEEEQKKRDDYRRKKKAGEIVEEEKPQKSKDGNGTKKEAPKSPGPLAPPGGGLFMNAQSAATLGAVAVLAAGAGFLAGGSRRS